MMNATQDVRIQTQQPPARVDSRELNERINDAVNQALSQVGDGKQENARQSLKDAVEEMRAQIEAARAEGRPITIQPQFEDAIPSGAVDISIAFFVSMAVIIVGLPLARAFARRMDRRGERASAGEIAPRLDRIEQAVEAIAIEVERVSEGQRYTTKAIAELRGLPVAGSAWPSASEAERVPVGETSRRP